jgi:hypothetical protein
MVKGHFCKHRGGITKMVSGHRRHNNMSLWDKFVELVKKHFAFLELDFQFKIIEVKSPFVWYASDKTKVRVYYKETGNWPYELDLSVLRVDDDPNTSLAVGVSEMILLSHDWREAEQYRAPFPKSAEELEIELPKLAEILKKYGPKILKADPNVFGRLERLREGRVREINEKARLNLKKKTVPKFKE